MFLWMRIDLKASDQKGAMAMLLETMKKCGVMMAPGVPFMPGEAKPEELNYLRAAFALVEPGMFDPALSRLAQAIEYVRKSHGSSKIAAESPRIVRRVPSGLACARELKDGQTLAVAQGSSN
ncbi:hypothetical protein FBU59_002017 [Linderina macrospora]|uniref:Uncharacterized protein n=1 Tax=Linderina macrospora TaxID=4868 RepID=A0ACC1JCQ3_9FUNG|nr:hypothetical protein FBU59_002017 [Linderina macrospora]